MVFGEPYRKDEAADAADKERLAREVGEAHVATAKYNPIWMRVLTKIGEVRKGSFEGSKMLNDHYWLEKLDVHHRPMDELKVLWKTFVEDDNCPEGMDFCEWLKQAKDIEPQQRVKYLPEKERAYHATTFEGNRVVLDPRSPVDLKTHSTLIFALDKNDVFYTDVKKTSTKDTERVHHSSLLAGAPVRTAGTIFLKMRTGGEINWIQNYSGHYTPTPKEFKCMVPALRKNGGDINQIKLLVETGMPTKATNWAIPGFIKKPAAEYEKWLG